MTRMIETKSKYMIKTTKTSLELSNLFLIIHKTQAGKATYENVKFASLSKAPLKKTFTATQSEARNISAIAVARENCIGGSFFFVASGLSSISFVIVKV